MAILKKRERIVSFRVSEDEYESLRAASESEGAHSISEYARRAACTKLHIADGPDVRQAVHQLRSRVDQLQDEMHRIARRVDQLV